jgi:hypothetical protein
MIKWKLNKKQVILGILISFWLPVIGQNYQWAKSFGYGQGTSITFDASGNVYTTGYFQDTVDFDPGPGVFNLSSSAGEVFILKLDPSGNFIWAKSVGGASYYEKPSITFDGFANVCITGIFENIGDFDPGQGTFYLSSNGNFDIFILKLDLSGNFVWAKSLGGSGEEYSGSLSVDGIGNVYITGGFKGTVDFDPSAGIFNMTSFGFGGQDIFVLKLNPSGNFNWAKRLGGIGEDIGISIVSDASGNVYTTGYFCEGFSSPTADFDPGPGTYYLVTSSSSVGFYISKLDALGNFVWAKSISDGETTGMSIKLDTLGNVYATGFFSAAVDFDPGPNIHILAPTTGIDNDIFILKLDISGNFLWAKIFGGPGNDGGISLDVDNSGNVYIIGNYNGIVDVDPNFGTFYLSPNGGVDFFILELNASGNFLWAKGIGGSLDDYGNSIAVDKVGNVYSIGFFMGTVDFSPYDLINLTSGTYGSIFILKMGTSMITNSIKNSSIISSRPIICPNPNNGSFTIKANDEASLSIFNNLGEIIQEVYLRAFNSYQTQVSEFTSGVYFLVQYNKGYAEKQKIVVIK